MATSRSTEPLVTLHGFAGGPSAWDSITARLDSLGEVFAPPLLGHAGALALEQTPKDFEQEVDRLAALVRARGITQAHLAGYSLGARLGLGLLLRHADLWLSATLVGVHPGLASPALRRARRASDRKWQQLLRTQGIAAFVRAWEEQALFVSQRQLPQAALQAQRALRLSHPAEGLAHSLELTGLGVMPDYHPELGKLRTPICLLTGQCDTKFSALACAAVTPMAHGRWIAVPAVGHNLLLEAPDAVARCLAEQVCST